MDSNMIIRISTRGLCGRNSEVEITGQNTISDRYERALFYIEVHEGFENYYYLLKQ